MPILEGIAVALFGILTAALLLLPKESFVFEELASPGERQVGRLIGLAGFAFGVTVLGVLTIVESAGMPMIVFILAVTIVAAGIFVEAVVDDRLVRPGLETVGFTIGGAATGGLVYGFFQLMELGFGLALGTFLVSTGALAAGLFRSAFGYGEDPLLVVGVGLLLWLFVEIGLVIGLASELGAVIVTTAIGVGAYILSIASIAGMLSGVLLALITLVYGGIGWFLVLLSFFGVGGLATKYRYDEKAVRGVAEDHAGARGTGNVLGNSLVALAAVIGYAGVGPIESVEQLVFALAFTGAVATALADTLSSEIGSLYDRPKLVTTLEPVTPGTDGAVTLEGTLAGMAGASLVALLTVALFDQVGVRGGGFIILAGTIGMFADSFFGATLENGWIENATVNLLATLVGALTASGLWLLTGG